MLIDVVILTLSYFFVPADIRKLIFETIAQVSPLSHRILLILCFTHDYMSE